MAKTLPNRIQELDALRGFAAICVVLFHKTMGSHSNDVLKFGVTGVDLFFMISGFVILMTLKKVKTSRQFIIGRISRLYPLFWVAVTLTALVRLVNGEASINQSFIIKYVSNLTMFHTYFLQNHLDGVYWTLTLEMCFYMLMLVFFIYNLLPKIEHIALVALFPLFIYGIYISGHIGVWSVRVHRFATLVEFLPLFISGIVYYNMKFDAKTPLRFVLLGLCFATQIALFHLGIDRIRWITTGQYTIVLALYNVLFMAFVYNRLNFIVNPVTTFLGTLSYAIYLVHNPIGWLSKYYIPQNLGFWLSLVISMGGIILVAYTLHKFVELPSLKYVKERWLKAKPQLTDANGDPQVLITPSNP
jgi:peptidoglycan/LPS O-acetylase OafA/YrhL